MPISAHKAKQTTPRVAHRDYRTRARHKAGVEDGTEYTDEEREFLAAIDRYKRENRRPFPTWIEVLNVLRGLGYRKVSHGE